MKNKVPISTLFDLFDYNSETGDLIWRVTKGSSAVKGSLAGTSNGRGYIQVKINGKCIVAHRIAYAMHNGKWPDAHVDHKNRDTSDNRACNLREATISQNMHNTVANKTNKSGLKGVSKTKKGKFYSSISIDNKRKWIGSFSTAEEAAEAYKEAAISHYGEFARTE